MSSSSISHKIGCQYLYMGQCNCGATRNAPIISRQNPPVQQCQRSDCFGINCPPHHFQTQTLQPPKRKADQEFAGGGLAKRQQFLSQEPLSNCPVGDFCIGGNCVHKQEMTTVNQPVPNNGCIIGIRDCSGGSLCSHILDLMPPPPKPSALMPPSDKTYGCPADDRCGRFDYNDLITHLKTHVPKDSELMPPPDNTGKKEQTDATASDKTYVCPADDRCGRFDYNDLITHLKTHVPKDSELMPPPQKPTE